MFIPDVDFRYQALAVAGDSGEGGGKPKTDHIVSGRKIAPDWILGLGEDVGQIQVIQSDRREQPSTLVVAANRTVCALLDTGIVVFMKRLDFAPLCALSFKPTSTAKEHNQCLYLSY